MGAWRTTRLIAAARWRTVRTPGARVWLWVVLVAGASSLSVAAQAGDLVRLVAEVDGNGTVAGVVANTYIRQWVSTGFGAITSAILMFAIAAAVVAPLVSSSAPTLMPEHHLAGVRTSSMHAYVSAAAVHLTSLMTFVQLLALTALAGLLTIDGAGRGRAVLLSWAAWLVMVGLAQSVLWASRALRRAPRPRVIGGTLMLALGLGAWAALSPYTSVSLFGLTAAYTWWLLAAPWWVALIVAVGAGALVGRAGWSWCANAVAANEVTAPSSGGDRPVRAMPSGPAQALIAMVVRSFIRTRSITAPLVTVTVLAAVAVTFAGDQPAAIWSLGVGLPVAVGLAFTDNAAGMTGPANVWVASLPRQGRRLLVVWGGWAWLVSFALVAAAWTPVLALGRVSWSSTASVLLTGAAAASTVTAVALWHAVRAPTAVRTDLGDGMLSASRAAAASLRLLAVPGMIAWVATSGAAALRSETTPAPLLDQCSGAGLCLLGALAVGTLVARRWSNPRTRALCLAAAS